MSGSQSVAEDVTQEVFIALMVDAGRFDSSKGSLSSYLYGIARNHVLRRIDRERMLTPLGDEFDEEAAADNALAFEDDPLTELTRREEIERVRSAILALPPHYREVVVLCELHEMSYKEAADVTGCAVGTVRSRLHRARGLLMEKLRDTGDRSSPALSSARCFA
jgi:RNA polymerase sigma-70 factor (ECF subfamily)